MRLSRRRALAALGILIAAPGVHAQARVRRIGYLELGTPEAFPQRAAAFAQGLREHGYTEGRELVIERRFAAGNAQELERLARELVAARVELVFAPTTVTALAARRATGTIPIVFAVPADPVGVKLVDSLARPGGNATGLTTVNVDVIPKRLQILRELSGASSVGLLFNPQDPSNVLVAGAAEKAAEGLGLRIRRYPAARSEELESAFAAASAEKIGALLVSAGALMDGQRARIAMLAAQSRIPALYGAPEFVEAGGLVSYSASFIANYRRAAAYVDRILKGAQPADLPVEQASEFELVINLKTAAALGLAIPASLQVRATRVIS